MFFAHKNSKTEKICIKFPQPQSFKVSEILTVIPWMGHIVIIQFFLKKINKFFAYMAKFFCSPTPLNHFYYFLLSLPQSSAFLLHLLPHFLCVTRSSSCSKYTGRTSNKAAILKKITRLKVCLPFSILVMVLHLSHFLLIYPQRRAIRTYHHAQLHQFRQIIHLIRLRRMQVLKSFSHTVTSK